MNLIKISLKDMYPTVASFWHPTKNGSLTPDKISHASGKRVWWKCPVADDHEWQTTVANRTTGKQKCPYCIGQKPSISNCLATIYPELAKQWHPTKNGSLTPENITKKSSKKVWWKCPVGDDHEWEEIVSNRAKPKRGCPYCSGRRVLSSTCLSATHPELAKQWHPTKNGSLTPLDVSYGSSIRIWWKCPLVDAHEWEAVLLSRSRGHGCPYCSNHKINLENCLATIYPELAKQWHPTKNGSLTPSDIGAGHSKKVWWKCPVADDHEWAATVAKRANLRGCPCCAGHKVVFSTCISATHPLVAAEFHPTKNGKLTPLDISCGSSTNKVWWKCPVADDHEWEALVASRCINGAGCPYCANLKVSLSNCMATTHPELAKQWHPTKNDSLTPYSLTAHHQKKVWWQCPKNINHEWEATPDKRSAKKDARGCPFCNESHGEKIIAKILDDYKILYKRQHGFKNCKNILPLPFDFVIFHNKKLLIIEYQGQQHYKPVSFGSKNKKETMKRFEQTRLNDDIKRKWCKAKNIPELEIPYWSIKKIESIIKDFLNNASDP
jgi:hypothetical protein